MVLELTLPLDDKGKVEDLVFTILSKEYPLRIIDLMNYIRKRYGKSVTFQAVRKAVLNLERKEVILHKNHRYELNKDWIRKSKEIIDNLYEELNKKYTRAKNVDSIGGQVSVFTFNSLYELMKFWQSLMWLAPRSIRILICL